MEMEMSRSFYEIIKRQRGIPGYIEDKYPWKYINEQNIIHIQRMDLTSLIHDMCRNDVDVKCVYIINGYKFTRRLSHT